MAKNPTEKKIRAARKEAKREARHQQFGTGRNF